MLIKNHIKWLEEQGLISDRTETCIQMNGLRNIFGLLIFGLHYYFLA